MTAVADLAPGVSDEFGIEVDDGVFVSDLVPDSAADEAGIELGDVIVEVEGDEVTEPQQVADLIRDRDAGDTIEIVLERSGERITVQATLSSRAEAGN